MKTHITSNRLIKGALIIGIIILLNLFFNYSTSLFVDEPQWDDFCPYASEVPATEAACVDAGGMWIDDVRKPGVAPSRAHDVAIEPGEAYCDMYRVCQESFNDARDDHNQVYFIVLVILGAIALIGGLFLSGISAVVGLGLAYGGVLSLFIASVRYWSSADEVVKVVILAVALSALIWIGIKKFSDER